MDKYGILKKYYGYDSFRQGQEKIIDCILSDRDVLAVMPTGAGKSLCFQIPALMKDGLCLVISPLISLMKDQITALRENGICAETVNSSMPQDEINRIYDEAYRGKYKLLYVSPEKLDNNKFRNFSLNIQISMICIDEAHCVSQWGHDFRSSYLRIADFISSLPVRPVVCAFTATATEKVRNDITELLELNNPEVSVSGFDRSNLYFEINRTGNKKEFIRNYLIHHKDSSGIIYCATRKNTDELAYVFREEGFSVTRYHAGLTVKERRLNQEAFVNGVRKVMIATNAFGMGIDKPDVRFVIHYNMPGDIESYYQEAGRAGRDGERAECILLFSPQDIALQKYFISRMPEDTGIDPDEAEKMKVRRKNMLSKMVSYASSQECLRIKLLSYFGQGYDGKCMNCSVCLKEDGRKQESSFSKHGEVNEELLYYLLNIRNKIAKEKSVPGFVIMTDAVIEQICALKPSNLGELRRIKGINEYKTEKYGPVFIKAIQSFELEDKKFF